MNLDEQIAWLENEWAMLTSAAGASESHGYDATRHRERAATLLTIENTLRTLRDAAG